MPVRWLDIGSGRNPVYFSPPDSLTVNKRGPRSKNWFTASYDPDPHIWSSASDLRLPPCSVENILFHFSVGMNRESVIDPDQLAETLLHGYDWLLPGGSVLIRSLFHGRKRFDPVPFFRCLLAAGFNSNAIDLIKCSDIELLPEAARQILMYCEHHDLSMADSQSAFLIATKDYHEQ